MAASTPTNTTSCGPAASSLFMVLIGVVGSFLFIRFSTRMIRAQVKWWPGNVTPGGMHIHHVVFGLVFLLIGGIGNFALRGEGRPYRELLALLFGIGDRPGAGRVRADPPLEDVYWAEEGRRSLDAVLLSVLLIGLLLIGEVPLGGRESGRHALDCSRPPGRSRCSWS